ncbi:flagellar basal-body MS-ring/collar protein FliF [uncultured Litoreibacter sp.]|uniref:flagellar basal-body MS-ring/collar protein FliF n=1 Tax=uncultured Litoreibacter sp. TaxID=1392394 RepID=UPI00261F014E|nr:flagellar basal-body MS-ring/collar protein FliF [uncultured Litoreibacter sp.]
MQQFTNVWSKLDMRRRMIVIGATAIVFVGVLLLARMAAQPNYALLYSGLSPKASGEVLASLDGQGVAYDVRNSAIYVDAVHRDALRLTLAAEGLPSGDVNGYELLDSLSGFGTTSQMFDAAYLRAKEGELARTILANPQISAARVHIAQSTKTPFRKGSTPTASVSIRGSAGGITPASAEAIRYLVASAVSGLQPESVSIINADLGTVMSLEDSSNPLRVGMDRAELLKRNVERLIEARTGVGNAIVEVNVETLTDDELITERRFDPEGRVVVSTQTQETSKNSQNSQGGDVTVASNLPDGDAAAGSDQSNSQNTETQETVNYELSETTRELRKLPGSIKRISVAVLVDGTEQPAADGSIVWEPRPAEEIAMLEELVKSAVGYDEARGDSVTIRSLELPAVVAPEQPDAGWATSQPFDVMKLSQLAATSLVVLVLGLFVIRPIVVSALANSQQSIALPQETNAEIGQALSGEIQDPPSNMSASRPQSNTSLPSLPVTDLGVDPVERLKALIDERQDETVEILRSWIEAPEEPA